MNATRPNVLVIMTDQQSATALSCAGNADLATPAIDSLARTGVRFEHAYCTSPLCAPSRASMITGLMPSALGVNDNIALVPESFPADTLGRIFAAAGYECAYAGKWHVPGVAHEGGRPGPAGRATSGFDEIFSGTHDGLAQACSTYLTAAERRDAPFLLVASFNEPHGICEWARGQRPPSGELPDPDWRELPLLPPNFAAGSEEPEALRQVQQFAWMVHPTQQWDEERWRRYRYAYHRLCERVDAEIATLLAGLDAAGLRDNTLIIFTSDHGDMQGAHQWNQKKVLYQEAAGVPFIVVPPGGSAAGRTSTELVSVGLDLLPTLCDYAGIEPAGNRAGRSVRPLLESGHATRPQWREHIVVETEWTFPGLMPPPVMSTLLGRLVRTERYAYLCHSWGLHREQLFDLGQDPGQLINLATSGRHQPILDDHRRRLREHCAVGDDRFARHVPEVGVPPR
ncbi:sulfatase family protein [Microlunatus parietis]|uniref:Arylsulfatase A-like enzyme n=1 Tax=Microlunatus parietis TaxID=682979 RepID=A0A7Y9ID86_9ACTN|nr:sulfatase-like hydrolase/transferase [Microlunatus parietis]NYE74179.1 arylsulfatase A-like enzyme [Microlunatus parietis]